MMTNRTRPFAASVAALCLLAACGPSEPPRPEKLLVKIEGMHCEGCAEGITKKLAQTRGVLATDVHFSNAVQAVDYDAARVSAEAVVATITNKGFTVTRAVR
jgi:copper chaperone CopZ